MPRHDEPSGLPEEQPDDTPLGVDHAERQGEDPTPRGDDAMPGIPTEGEPQSDG